MEVYELKVRTQLLVGSANDPFGYLPTIPGQPDDGKHLT